MTEVAPPAVDGEGGVHEVRPSDPPRARWALLLSVAAVVLALDQLSKAWAVSALGDGHVIELVGSLRLRLTMNYGSAFSIANGRGALISLLAIVVVVVLLRTGRHARSLPMAIALGLVLGGGVVDFVDLQWWPVFNLADSAIVVGALLLFVVQWREAEQPDADADADTDADGDDLADGREPAQPAAADPGTGTEPGSPGSP